MTRSEAPTEGEAPVAAEPASGDHASTPGTGAPARGSDPGPGPVPFAGLRLAALIGVLVLLGVVNPWMLVVIAGLLVMITLHELGHFLTAKRAGMKVTEFFLGFGPRIWSVRRGETEYGIKVIPAGAYVKIIGMHNLEEVAPEDEGRTYRQKSFGQRLSVAVAGSTMHFLLAVVLIFLALSVVGQPAGTMDLEVQEREWRVGSVIEGSGADDAGIREGDRVLAIAGEELGEFETVREVVGPLEGETVPVLLERGGERRTVEVTLRPFVSDGQEGCCLGISRGSAPEERLGVAEGLVRAPVEFVDITVTSVQALGRFFTPGGVSDFASQVWDAREDRAARTADPEPAPTRPSGGSSSSDDAEPSENRIISILGLVQIGSDVGKVDPAALISIYALVNIFIGVFNLVPLLPFDGGHVAIAVYEKVQERRLRRRRYFADVARLLPLTMVVIGLLGALFLSTIYLDLTNPLVTR